MNKLYTDVFNTVQMHFGGAIHVKTAMVALSMYSKLPFNEPLNRGHYNGYCC